MAWLLPFMKIFAAVTKGLCQKACGSSSLCFHGGCIWAHLDTVLGQSSSSSFSSSSSLGLMRFRGRGRGRGRTQPPAWLRTVSGCTRCIWTLFLLRLVQSSYTIGCAAFTPLQFTNLKRAGHFLRPSPRTLKRAKARAPSTYSTSLNNRGQSGFVPVRVREPPENEARTRRITQQPCQDAPLGLGFTAARLR